MPLGYLVLFILVLACRGIGDYGNNLAMSRDVLTIYGGDFDCILSFEDEAGDSSSNLIEKSGNSTLFYTKRG